MRRFSTQLKGILRTNIYNGLFISLEGLDGSGKTSQMKPLEDYFKSQGREVLTFHWPRKEDGILAHVTAGYLQGRIKLPKPAAQYLFSANYVIFSEEVIIPALQEGKVVLSDRCHFWSGIAYGTWESGGIFDPGIAKSLLVTLGVTTNAYQFIIPDMTFYLNISVEGAMRRLAKKRSKKDIYEKRDILEKVKQGYDWLLKEFSEEFIVIDADRSIDVVTKDMIKVIEQKR